MNRPISCTQVTLCNNSSVCYCSEEGCTAQFYNDITPEMHLEGDTITGSVELDFDSGIAHPLAFHLARVR